MHRKSWGQGQVKLIITIDTEEDNWGDYRPTGHTVRNIERIHELQQLFDSFAVRPTYLISYPVADDDCAVSILKGILERRGCEIGTHCHPWNTPPFEEETNVKNSMLCNLPASLQYRKIQILHNLIHRRFGVAPTSFRSGRWGYGPDVAGALQALEYSVDSSITPYYSWRDSGGPDYSEIGPKPYLFSPDHPYTALDSDKTGLIEIPVTVGYLQNDFDRSSHILRVVNQKPIKRFLLQAVLSNLGLVNQIWLCPELFDGPKMIDLACVMKKKGYALLNLFFHSPTLLAGLSPYTQTQEDVCRFLERIKIFLAFAREAGIESITLSEGADLIKENANPLSVRSADWGGGGT